MPRLRLKQEEQVGVLLRRGGRGLVVDCGGCEGHLARRGWESTHLHPLLIQVCTLLVVDFLQVFPDFFLLVERHPLRVG